MNLGRLAAHIGRGIFLKTATSWLAHSHWFSRLHQLIEAHCSALVEQLAPRGKFLPDHVLREFDVFLKCGRLEHGFLRMRCKKKRLTLPRLTPQVLASPETLPLFVDKERVFSEINLLGRH